MPLQLLRAADRPARAWKNGGGVSREIVVSPPGASLDDFDWRISAATVAIGGPFSTFPGVDRLMLVLEGRLELDMAGAEPLLLDDTGAAFEFSGDSDISARTPAAPVIDFNVMVRRRRFTASLERRVADGRAAVVCQDVTLVLCRAGELDVALGLERQVLGPDDAAMINGARGALARIRLTGQAVIAHINAVR